MQVHVLLMDFDMDLVLRLVSVLEGYMLGVRWVWRVWLYTSLYCEAKIKKDTSLGNLERVKNNSSINGLILLVLVPLCLTRSSFSSETKVNISKVICFLGFLDEMQKVNSLQVQNDPDIELPDQKTLLSVELH